jgi:1-acyl-sn-glycerol-3-phosphate acyltransferase
MGQPPDRTSTVLRPLSRAGVEPVERSFYAVTWLAHSILRGLTRRDWRGQDRIPRVGGVVFAVNHISNVDPLAVGQYLALSGRWPRFLAKSSLFTMPVLGRLFTACGQIPVERNTRTAGAALTHAIRAIQQGKAVVVYPEGTITSDPDLWPMAGKTGAARIAYATGCPIIPIGQWGAQEIMYGKQIAIPRLLPRKTLRLQAGDPIPLDPVVAGKVTSAALAATTARIMAALTALVGELRGESPPPPAPVADPGLDRPDAAR